MEKSQTILKLIVGNHSLVDRFRVVCINYNTVTTSHIPPASFMKSIASRDAFGGFLPLLPLVQKIF